MTSHKVRTRYIKKRKSFGANLKRIREQKGLTQEHVAFTAGIAFSSINKIENGHINFTIGTLYAIAESLKVDVKELFS
jgi:transcriptional regulator with XRE-family HTH domain